jgi:hypothetical protein
MTRWTAVAFVLVLLLPVAARAETTRYPTLDRMLRRFSREARERSRVTVDRRARG